MQIVGVDPRAYRQGHSRPWELVDESADLRILLCHFPYVLSFLPPGAFDLVLSGHMHDGQIALPLGRDRKFRFAHPSVRFATGLYERPGGTMHVSPGLGTTFVPFRFFARPEATELVLQTPQLMATISSDILASYAADAAREVDGVRGLVESAIPRHKGVRISEEDGRVRVELHLAVEWGASVPDVGREVQQRVAAYLERMAKVDPEAVDVIVDEIGPQ